MKNKITNNDLQGKTAKQYKDAMRFYAISLIGFISSLILMRIIDFISNH